MLSAITGGDGEHDAVAERDNGLFHRLLGVVAVRNRPAGAQQVGFEQPVHEIQGHRWWAMPCRSRVEFRERDLAGVVLRAVVERQAGDHLVARSAS